MTKPYQKLIEIERQKIEGSIENTAKQRTRAELENVFLAYYGYCLKCKSVVPTDWINIYEDESCYGCHADDKEKSMSYKVVMADND